MAFPTQPPLLALLVLCPLLMHTASSDDYLSTPTTRQSEMILSQHITHLTEALDLDDQTYRIKTFVINHGSGQVTLLIQHNSAPLIQDSSQRGNLLLAIDHSRIYITPLNNHIFNWFGLYNTKIFHEQNKSGISGPRSIAFDWIHQTIYFAQDNTIQMLSLCPSQTHNMTLVLPRTDDTRILSLEVDPLRKRLCWLESIDLDHYRLMVSDTNYGSSEAHVLHESSSGQCSAMTLDFDKGYLYWVHNGQLFRKSYQYDDQHSAKVEFLLQHKDLIVDRIQIQDNYLYYTSMQKRLFRIRVQPTRSKPEEMILLEQQAHFIVSFHVTTNNGSNALEQSSWCNPTTLNSEIDMLDFLRGLWAEISHYQWNKAEQLAPIILASGVTLTIHLCLYLAYCCARMLSR